MKTNAIVRIVLLSIAIIVLLTILLVGIAAGMFMFTGSETSTTSSGNVPAAEVRSISVDWAAGSITIRTADTNQITFTETGAEDSDVMVWRHAGDKLEIDYSEPQIGIRFGNTSSKHLLIEVPRDWSLNELEIEAASADLDVDSLLIATVDFDGASGYCRFQDCTVDVLDVDTASGNIQFIGTLNVLECDAASADCDITLTNSPSRIDMDMASGDLTLALPEDCGFTAELEGLSGSIESEFDTTVRSGTHVYGDGSCRISVSALSGDISIRKNISAQ